MCGAIDELPSSTSPAFQPRAQSEWEWPAGIFIPHPDISAAFSAANKGGNNRAILQFDNNND